MTMRKPSLVTLSPDECVALLRSARFGRLAIVLDHRPHVVPLNFAVDDDGTVVFRTGELTVATNAALANVAFEVDAVDDERREGWSVVVHGVGREIGDAVDAESQRLLRLPVEPWAPDARNRWYKITPSEITGRRLVSRS